MRCASSGSRNTSSNAMHKLFQLESMQTRNKLLNIKFLGRLHNARDSGKPAIKLYRSGLESLKKNSLVSRSREKNELWRKRGIKQTNLLLNPLIRGDCCPTPIMEKKLQKEIVYAELMGLDRGLDNISGTLFIENLEKKRHVTRANNGVRKDFRINIVKWMLGNICTHQTCKVCGEKVSRSHGVECSGAGAFLETRMGHLLTERNQYSLPR